MGSVPYSVAHVVVTCSCALNAYCAIGNGGYGRLGHVKQEDSFKPKLIETFNQRVPVAPTVVSALLHLHLYTEHVCHELYS